MMNTDYRTEAIRILLSRDCTLEKYYPLIPYKDILTENLIKTGCKTKSDCMKLSDEALIEAGLKDIESVRLFRRFLNQYDIKPAKLKEIAAFCISPEEEQAFRELYHLPGVKHTRAALYFRAGFRALTDIAASEPREIIERTKDAIQREKLNCIVPLMKEIKTHIAVAKAFTNRLTE